MTNVRKDSIKLKNLLFDAINTKGAFLNDLSISDFISTLKKIKEKFPHEKRTQKDIGEAKRIVRDALQIHKDQEYIRTHKEEELAKMPLIQDEKVDVMAERNKS